MGTLVVWRHPREGDHGFLLPCLGFGGIVLKGWPRCLNPFVGCELSEQVVVFGHREPDVVVHVMNGRGVSILGSEPLSLHKAGEWPGLWWPADKPEDQMPGVLRYDPEGGLELTLIGRFADPNGTTLAWHMIHGAADRREMSLLDCALKNSRRTSRARVNSPDEQVIAASTAVIGAHIDGDDEAVFVSAEVSVEDLGFWAATSVFGGSVNAQGGRLDGSGTISVGPLPTQTVEVDGTKFELEHRHTLPFFDRRRGGTQGRMHDTAFIRIVPPRPSSLREATDSARLIQDLIALAMHRAAGVISLRLKRPKEESAPISERPRQERNVDVIYSPTVVGKPDEQAIDAHRVLFTCDALPFEDVIPRWLEVQEKLRAATNMALGLRYAPARYVENNLLTAVGAAEVLHRGLRIDQPPIPFEEFHRIREDLMARVPEQHKERIQGLIRNDPTLGDRLFALALRPDQEAISTLMPDIDWWARRTARARNDLAHEGRTPKHTVDELIAIVEVTSAVVTLNVLNELGLPPERQREIVQLHPQLRATSEAAGEWLHRPETEP